MLTTRPGGAMALTKFALRGRRHQMPADGAFKVDLGKHAVVIGAFGPHIMNLWGTNEVSRLDRATTTTFQLRAFCFKQNRNHAACPTHSKHTV